jgi:RNA polymerase sigma-70 factor (ECF subfamily)
MVAVPSLDTLSGDAPGADSTPSADEIEARLATARAAWPDIELPEGAYARRLVELSAPALPPAQHAADLYLALGCAFGVPAALAAFARQFDAHMAKVIARVDPSPSFGDEVMQTVREKLFVAHDGNPPKVVEYGGRASLRTWIQVVVKRAALNLVRGADRNGPARSASDADLVAASDPAPELAYMKALYREHFEEATREAFRALTTRERSVLRLHLAERMTLGQLGAVYGVSHATAARWLAATQEKVVTSVRRSLTERLVLTRSDFEGVASLVLSQLDVRIVELLRSGTIPQA